MDTKAEDELAAKLEKIQLPSRANRRPVSDEGYGMPINVYLNVFGLDMKDAPSTIHKYELTFTMTKKTGEEYTVHNALTKVHEHTRTKKRNCLVALQSLVHVHNKAHFAQQAMGDAYWRACYAFDCGSSYFTGVKIPDCHGAIEESVWKQSNPVVLFCRGRGDIKWNLTHVESFPIQGESAKTPQAMQFFDILTQQKMNRDESMEVKPDAAYISEGKAINENKVLRKGVVASSKIVGDGIGIQLDSKISMFFPAEPLLDYIRRASGARSEADIVTFLKDSKKSRQLRKELINLPLLQRHIPTQRTFEFKGFHNKNANSMEFMKEGQTKPITVAEYIHATYHYTLKMPTLPLVVEGKNDKAKFHAIECLDIAPGVRVSNQKMTRNAQDDMIKSSCRAPDLLVGDLEKSRVVAGLDGQHKFLKAFNIKLAPNFSEFPAQILFKPQVLGLGGVRAEMNPQTGQIAYLQPKFKFAEPAKPDKPITLLALDKAVNEKILTKIKEGMERFCNEDLGMRIKVDVEYGGVDGGDMELLDKFMQARKAKTSMFFIVTRDKMDADHNMVKKLEQQLGVVTQMMCERTALDFANNKRVTMFNILAKMNQKLGGVTSNPEVPPQMKHGNKEAYERACQDWFKGRMFVGLTLSHAGSQSFADRVAGTPIFEPTCVGMAFTLNLPGKRTALSWFQEKRQATIDDMERHFVEALEMYAKSTGKLPKAILVFRKGMSDGEFKKAALEMKQIRHAIEKVKQRMELKTAYKPTIQCLVCISNTDRLFTSDGARNVPAGTCIAKQATPSERFEFLIVPHNAIKGTAKVVRCTLVYEKAGDGRLLEYPELQSIVNSMCYLNGVAATPTRLPVPLSDSEKAAERQMNLFKQKMRYGDDTASQASGRSTSACVHDGSDTFYQRLTDDFKLHFPTPTQYYA